MQSIPTKREIRRRIFGRLATDAEQYWKNTSALYEAALADDPRLIELVAEVGAEIAIDLRVMHGVVVNPPEST